MCGILFSIAEEASESTASLFNSLIPLITARGPDCQHSLQHSFQRDHEKYFIEAYASVLSIRKPLTKQPLVSDDCMLMFNGELYGLGPGNDTAYLFDRLINDGVMETLKDIRGEYAFVFVEHSRRVWFTRDRIGRRSLQYRLSKNSLMVSSVGDETFSEVQGNKIYCYDLETHSLREKEWETPNAVVSPVISHPYNPALLFQKLKKSVELRAKSIEDGQGSVAVLFSGGLDCTIIAYLLSFYCDNIHLINVAFESARTGQKYDAAPDRKLGQRSFEELKKLRQHVNWKFVPVNVSYQEMLQHQSTVVQLITPKDSVMDFSIAVAFYFASKGSGPSKVLFSGLGADELFGGYTRHATRLEKSGYESLAQELQVDFDRLHDRNLGRDDRVCSHWGKEVRYPFLDEDVIAYAMDCPLESKVVKEGKEISCKHILRLVAKDCGFDLVCYEKKRAIQFGARSAKMGVGEGKIKGTDKLLLANDQQSIV